MMAVPPKGPDQEDAVVGPDREPMPAAGDDPTTNYARVSARMQVVLTLVVPSGDERDVFVDASADATCAELVEALRSTVPTSGPKYHALYAERLGVWPDLRSAVVSLGLRNGDRLLLAPRQIPAVGRSTPDTHAIVELVVIGGPASGLTVTLPRGRHHVGREAPSGIVIPDPTVSQMHLEIDVDTHSIVVNDAGSTNGTFLEGAPLTEATTIEHGQVLEIGSTAVSFRAPTVSEAESARHDPIGGTIPFNRPPRTSTPPTVRRVPLEAPPAEPSRRRLPLASALLPLALGAVFYALTRNVATILFMVLSPLMAVWSVVDDRRSGRKDFKERAAAFRVSTEQARIDAADAVRLELVSRRAAAPDPAALAARAEEHAHDLWERRRADPDFLSLRLGLADRPAQSGIDLVPGGAPQLVAEANPLIVPTMLPAVPALVSLLEVGAFGLTGPGDVTHALARALVVQVSVLQSPRDVVMGAVVPLDRLPGWAWLRWLPHTRSDTSPLGAEPVAAEPASVQRLFRSATDLLEARRAESRSSGTPSEGPAVLLLIDGEAPVPRDQAADLLEYGPAQRIYCIWMERRTRDLPGECGATAAVGETGGSLNLAMSGGETIGPVTIDGLPLAVAERVARSLAPLRDVSERNRGQGIPERLGVLELLELPTPTASDVSRRWAAHRRGLSVELGSSAAGAVTFDLAGDGPHALVGGTTGSGKSELLQSLVAAIATAYPPNRVTFLLVDYKGGAAFRQCVALPHTVGLVTDLDPHLTRRALVSLDAEIKRREVLLLDAGNLEAMERSDPEAAPPRLVIIIDEFATLAKEVPAFVEGIVDVAQRGRSLGLHLVLATQRPSGVINDKIRANVSLRVALRVSDDAESHDIIGAPDAAQIPRRVPGRAYLRSGPRQLVEFQAAFAGARSDAATTDEQVLVLPIGPDGRPVAPLRRNGDDDMPTDLERLVACADDAARAGGIQRQSAPWLPPLADVVPLAELLDQQRGTVSDHHAPFGLGDDPETQTQRVVTLDLEADGAVLIYGAGGTGKTSLLRTVAAGLASESSPADLQLYGLDFGAYGLSALDALPHCGSVIPGDDQERVMRLLSTLGDELARRKELFGRAGVSSLSEYRRAAGASLPRIVVLLDSYASFAAAFERVDFGRVLEEFPRLVADGRQLGVHFVISAERRGAIPGGLAGVIPSRVVLRLASDDEYSALGLDPVVVRGARLPAGRGFIGRGTEFQAAVVGSSGTGETQVAALQALGTVLRQRFPGLSVPSVRTLPLDARLADLPVADDPFVTLGIADRNLQPISLDLRDGHFLVVGPLRSGRSNVLRVIATGLRAGDPTLEMHLLAPRRSELAALDLWTSSARAANCDELAARLAQIVNDRDPDAAVLEPLVVVVDDGQELDDTHAADSLVPIVRRGRDVNVHVIASAETRAVHQVFGGWLSHLRKEKAGFLLNPDRDIDGELFGVRLPRQETRAFPPGRGYLAVRGSCELVQVALAE